MLNQKLFNILFNFGNKHKKITILITKGSCYLFFILYFLGYNYILLNFHKYNYNDILKYTFVPLLTIIIAKIIRKKINSKRPFEKMDIISLIKHKGGGAMPSNHATSSMVLAISFMYILPKYSILYIILAILTGISRIMAGLHYPIDILTGFLLGIATGLLGFYILF